VLLSIALTAQLAVLSPVLNTPFWGDDSANAYTSGMIRLARQSFWTTYWNYNVSQVNQLGRPMPLGLMQTYGLFDVLHDRVVYKLLLVAVTLLASAMLALVIRRLGAPAAAAALAAAAPAAVWQLHLLHDPLMSYAGLVQTVMIYVCGGILMFLAWLRQGGRWRLAAVVLLFACANLTYEDAYLMGLVLVPIAWYERRCSWRRALVLALPGELVSVAFVIVALILEQRLTTSSGYQVGGSPGTLLTAWAKILTSGLPVIGWAMTPGPLHLAPSGVGHSVLRGIAVSALLFPLVFAAGPPGALSWLHERRIVGALLGVAAVVMLTPTVLTAAAPQYQRVLVWGWGYLPMFFAAIGWAVLGTGLVLALLARLPSRRSVRAGAAAVVALGAGALAGVNAEGSARVVAYMQPSLNSRELIEASFTHGVLARVPSRSAVLWYGPEIGLPQSIWSPASINVAAWTREFVNRPLTMRILYPETPDARVCSDATGAPAPCRLLPTPTFWLRTASAGADGFVALAQIGTRRWSPTASTVTASSSPGSQPVAFVRDPGIGASGPLPFEMTVAPPSDPARPAPVASADVHVLRRGAGWALVQLAPQPRFVAISIGVTFR
jgi:hypothetical protein